MIYPFPLWIYILLCYLVRKTAAIQKTGNRHYVLDKVRGALPVPYTMLDRCITQVLLEWIDCEQNRVIFQDIKRNLQKAKR